VGLILDKTVLHKTELFFINTLMTVCNCKDDVRHATKLSNFVATLLHSLTWQVAQLLPSLTVNFLDRN